MFFLHNSRRFYILSTEIDLRNNPHLHLLQFNFRLEEEDIREEQDVVIKWFGSICESVTSRSLVVQVDGLFNEPEICNRIQDILLTLHTRTETLSIFLSEKDDVGRKEVDLEDVRELFSRLYEAGIVVERSLDWVEEVSDYLLTSKLPYLIRSYLVYLCFLSIVLDCDSYRCHVL